MKSTSETDAGSTGLFPVDGTAAMSFPERSRTADVRAFLDEVRVADGKRPTVVALPVPGPTELAWRSMPFARKNHVKVGFACPAAYQSAGRGPSATDASILSTGTPCQEAATIFCA
ncbi:MAG: hypothetical protein LBS92_00015 [Candidatus Methanoplasma sp.]|nr:hypothetical protein [Candidatus Methanoplasma sp.]